MCDKRDDDYFETDEWGEDVVPSQPARVWRFEEEWRKLSNAKAIAIGDMPPRRKGRRLAAGVLESHPPMSREECIAQSERDLEAKKIARSSKGPREKRRWANGADAPALYYCGVPFYAAPVRQPVNIAPIAEPTAPPSQSPRACLDIVVEDDDAHWVPSASEERARTLWESGVGTSPSEIKRRMAGIRADDDRFSDLLVSTFGENGEGLDQGVKSLLDLQRERPYVYVVKKRLRSRSYKVRLNVGCQGVPDFTPRAASRRITTDEFVNLYSAVAFANRCGLILNCHVTILWGALGFTDHDEIAEAFLGFTRRLRDWCAQRGFETAWIYSHENSPLAGLHTHILLSVQNKHAREFRAYAMESLAKVSRIKPLPTAPKAVDVKIRAPRSADIEHRRQSCIRVQWLWFQYLTKGMDGATKFERIRCPGDRFEQIYLGDLIRFWPQDTGVVNCKNRVGMSRNLSPSRRASGYINEDALIRAPRFKSALEMNNDHVDVRRLYSDAYHKQFLAQARQLYGIHGINIDKLAAEFASEGEVLPRKAKVVPAKKAPKPAGPRKRKAVLVPGRLRASAEGGGEKD